MKFDTKRDIKRLLGVLAGATLLALNLKTFVSAGGLFREELRDSQSCYKE